MFGYPDETLFLVFDIAYTSVYQQDHRSGCLFNHVVEKKTAARTPAGEKHFLLGKYFNAGAWDKEKNPSPRNPTLSHARVMLISLQSLEFTIFIHFFTKYLSFSKLRGGTISLHHFIFFLLPYHPLTPSTPTPSHFHPLTPSPFAPSPLRPLPLHPFAFCPFTPSPLHPFALCPFTPSPFAPSPLRPFAFCPFTPSPLRLLPLHPFALCSFTPLPLRPFALCSFTPTPLHSLLVRHLEPQGNSHMKGKG